jgi:hypothetical protein
MADPKMVLEVAGREVAVSNPGKVYFPKAGLTKLDLVQYYLAVADGALGGVAGRPSRSSSSARRRNARTGSRPPSCASRPAGPPTRSCCGTRPGSCGWSTWAAST